MRSDNEPSFQVEEKEWWDEKFNGLQISRRNHIEDIYTYWMVETPTQQKNISRNVVKFVTLVNVVAPKNKLSEKISSFEAMMPSQTFSGNVSKTFSDYLTDRWDFMKKIDNAFNTSVINNIFISTRVKKILFAGPGFSSCSRKKILKDKFWLIGTWK